MTDLRLFSTGAIVAPGRDGVGGDGGSPRPAGATAGGGGRDGEVRPGRLQWLLLALGLLPVAAGLRLVTSGGGYLVSDWGAWACLLLLALAALLAAGAVAAPSRAALLAPLCLAGLGIWSLASIAWAAWPQNALVEGDRELFYATALALALLTLRRPSLRRWAVLAVAASSGGLALGLALLLWHGSSPAHLFSSGRLVADAGYTGGLGAALAIGFWPAVAAASDRAAPFALRVGAGLLAGACLAALVPVEARAPLIALGLGGVVVLALGPAPLRTGSVALAAAAAVALRWHELNGAYSSGGLDLGPMRATGRGIVEVAIAMAVLTAALALADRRIRVGPFGRQVLGTMAAIVLAAAAIAATAAVVERTGGDPAGWLRAHASAAAGDQAPAHDGTRLLWLSPHDREDLWRVGALAFGQRPLSGWGGGNFGYVYEHQRRVYQQVQQAHSESLEVASTLGYPGLLLYVPFLALPLAAALVLRRRAASDAERLTVAAAAGGFAAFAAHSQVDWIWHISGATLPALVLAAVPLAALPGRGRLRAPGRAGIALTAAVLVAALALVVPPTLAQRYLLRSYSAPAPQALADARRADDLDWLSGRPQLAVARIDLDQGDAAGAVAASRRAVAAEPRFWVAWELLQVSAGRAGNLAQARHAERMVERLSPRLPLTMRDAVPSSDFDHY